jgi:mono/diheme cytochrome c family protein
MDSFFDHFLALAYVEAANFHGAPASTKTSKNPYAGQVARGKESFATNCAKGHGQNAEGMGNVPSLNTKPVKAATAGELFWFITHRDPLNGMPDWEKLPSKQRWEMVSYLQALGTKSAEVRVRRPVASTSAVPNAPPPNPPFTDFRYEHPGTVRKITVNDLPAPFATPSAENGPKIVARPGRGTAAGARRF